MNLIKHTHRGMTPWFDDIDRWFDTAFAPIHSGYSRRCLEPQRGHQRGRPQDPREGGLAGCGRERPLRESRGQRSCRLRRAEVRERERRRELHRLERVYGSFERSFTLPDSAATDKVAAKYDKGVLKVEIPKIVAKPKKAKVVKIG